MRPGSRLAALTLALALCAVPLAARAAAPRLVRVPLTGALTLPAVLEAGLDVVEVHRPGAVVILEWPGDEVTLARLGAAPEVLDADPGRTAAARTRAEVAAGIVTLPAPRDVAAPLGGGSTQALPSFGSGSMGGYWTLSEVKMKLDQLVAADTHDVVADSLDSLGVSRQGRTLWGLRLGRRVVGPDTRPVVFYNALTHAREPEGMQALFYFVDDLLAKYGTDPLATALLDQRVLYIVPVVNPDGYQINIDSYVASGGTSFGFWRKNARDNDLNGTINGQDGVDLNRNYGYLWGFNNAGSSGSFASEVYRGTAAFSEPETRAQRDILAALQPRTALSFHTYSDLYVHAWGTTAAAPADSAAFFEWNDEMTRRTGYQSGPGPRVLYEVNGDFDDWCYGDTSTKPRLFSWTPEIGNFNDGFYPAPSRITPLAAENLHACYTVAEIAGAALRVDRMTLPTGAITANGGGPIAVRARNLGLAATGAGLTGTLTSLDPAVTVLSSTAGYPDLAPHQGGDGDAWYQIATADTVTVGRLVRLLIEFTTPAGLYSRDTLEFPVGVPTVVFAENCDGPLDRWNSVGGWAMVPGDAAHPAPYVADSPPAGAPTYGLYVANSTARLTLVPPLDLSHGLHAYATLDSRWDIETGYDYLAFEASRDGAAWTALGGNATAVGVAPFQPPGAAVLSGTHWNWSPQRIDLSAFTGAGAGAVRLRFRIGSDGGGQFDGLNFDGLSVTLYDPAAQDTARLAVTAGGALAFALGAPAPNPARERARFAFTLPRAGRARLEVLDPAGRRVRALADRALGPGRQSIEWDLRDGAGRAVAPGLYLVRLSGESGALTRRFVVLR